MSRAEPDGYWYVVRHTCSKKNCDDIYYKSPTLIKLQVDFPFPSLFSTYMSGAWYMDSPLIWTGMVPVREAQFSRVPFACTVCVCV